MSHKSQVYLGDTTTPPPALSDKPPPLPTHPRSCRPLLIATYNPEEGALREHLLDRISITLSADVPGGWEERVQAIDAAVRFQDEATAVLAETSELTGALCTNVILAREYLKEVEISVDQVRARVGAGAEGAARW